MYCPTLTEYEQSVRQVQKSLRGRCVGGLSNPSCMKTRLSKK